jgi:hypothetical protein
MLFCLPQEWQRQENPEVHVQSISLKLRFARHEGFLQFPKVLVTDTQEINVPQQKSLIGGVLWT